jgi:hypothetical protein
MEMTMNWKTSNIQHSTFNVQRAPGSSRWKLNVECCALNVLRFILLPLLVFQFPATGAFAAGQLQVDLTPLGMRARNEAPIPVVVKFDWDGTHILEGRLEMEFHEGNRILGHYRSGDLALTGGEQKFRMLLPPSLAPFSDSQVEVGMKFLTAAGAIDLDPSVLFLPTTGERSLVLCWCDAITAEGRPTPDVLRKLSFDRFAPPSNDAYQRLLMTSVARLVPEDLPAQPLGYTAFDVLVLSPDAFKEAGERQLQALARWVRGGGSVCVFVAGGLKPQHIAFLNELDNSASNGPAFQADAAGNLLPARNGILCLRSGVGRSVIVTGESAETLNLDTADLRKAAAFLWKMRSSQARAIADSGHWATFMNNPAGGNPAFGRMQAYSGPLSYSDQPTALGGEVMSRLMPETVRLIPFSALFGMLVLFVVLIGPGDYFVLGIFRRRRLTWVLFPAVSIAFTVATVLMANHYLGLRDQRRSLFVVDLARDGTALRWSRYELVFAARDKQSVTELKDALWAPLKVQAQMPGQAYGLPGQPYVRVINGRQVLIGPNQMAPNYPGAISSAGSQGETEPPLYDGALPVHYETLQPVRQWQPRLNRIFSFEPPPVPLPPNWKAVEAAWPNLQNVEAKLSADKPFAGDVCAISGANFTSTGAASQRFYSPAGYPLSISYGPGFGGILPADMLEGLCQEAGGGLWTLVSQISPSGGGNFEDVSAMDTETNDSALVVVTRNGDDIVVFRRFFYGN